MLENEIMKLIQIEAPKHGCRLFRYQVGLFYTQNGTPIRIGVPGVSDLIGWQERTNLPSRFLACEVKTTIGRLSPEQQQFINAVNKSGGLAFCARSVEQFIQEITK